MKTKKVKTLSASTSCPSGYTLINGECIKNVGIETAVKKWGLN